MAKNDSIIVLAFPETNVVQVNMWYDKLTKLLRVNKNEHYVAGHAAAILVEYNTGNIHYFDFGRYHTPPKHGRIRDNETDPELHFKTKAIFCEQGNILNLLEIIEELSQNAASHGDGKIVYSIYKGIHFEKAHQFAKNWQLQGAIPYGPFELKGTNCSRFVARLIREGQPDFLTKLKLHLPKYTTASPVGNVKTANKHNTKAIFEQNINIPSRIAAQRNLNRTLQEPIKPNSVPESAQWLSGEGAGSWLFIEQNQENYLISRYSPKGILEFKKVFTTTSDVDITKEFQFTYISNGVECNLVQKGKKALFLAKK